MKKSSLILLTACACAPLYAQNEAPLAAAAAVQPAPLQIITDMLSPATPTPATASAAARAAIFPTLANIPAGCDFISCSNIPSFIQKMEAKGMLEQGSSAQSPVIGMSFAGKASQYEAIFGVVSSMSDYTTFNDALNNWALEANADYAPVIKMLAKGFESCEVLLPSLIQSMTESEFCTYLNIELSQEAAMMASMYLAQADQLTQGLPEGITITREGTKMTISIQDTTLADMIGVDAESLGLKGKQYFVSVDFQSGVLSIAFASSLDQIQWADKPENSILATDAVAFMDKQLSDNAFFAQSISAEGLNSLNNVQKHTLVFEGVAGLFMALGEVKAENKPVFDAAAAAIAGIGENYQVFLPDYKSPLSMLGWMDDDINIECKTPSYASYQAGSLKLSALADNPDTLVYAEGTDLELSDINLDKLATLPGQAQAVANAVSLTLKPEAAMQVSLGSMAVGALFNNGEGLPPEYAPMYQMVAGSLKNIEAISKSVGDSCGLIVYQGPNVEDVPPFVAMAGITDKASFNGNVGQLFDTIGGFIQGQLPKDAIQISEFGDVTKVSVGDDKMRFTALLSSNTLSISNNAKLQAKAAVSSITIPTAGAVMMVNMKPLSTLVKASAQDEPDTIETFDMLEKAIKSFYATVLNDGEDMLIRFKIDLY